MFVTQKMILLDLLVLQKHIDAVSELIVQSGYFEPSHTSQVADKKEDIWMATDIHDRKKVLLDFQKYALDIQNFFHSYTNYRSNIDVQNHFSIPQIGEFLKKYHFQKQYFSEEYEEIYKKKILSAVKIAAWRMYHDHLDSNVSSTQSADFVHFFGVLDIEKERILEDIIHDLHGMIEFCGFIDDKSIYFFRIAQDLIDEFNKNMSSLDFTNFGLPEEYFGKHADNILNISLDYTIICDREEILDLEFNQYSPYILDKIEEILITLHLYIKITEVKRSMRQVGHFVIVSGWIFAHRFRDFKRQIRKLCGKEYELVATDFSEFAVDIPTGLSNPTILKPFENLVTTFGIPSYREIDPTLFFAFLYTLMYGAMFGDVGQGMMLVIAGLIGLILYKNKSVTIPGIMVWVGSSSIFFGFLYGSYFGYESEIYEWLPSPIWMNPMQNISKILVITTLFGVGVILFSYVLSIINSVRMKEWRLLIFSHKGIAAMLLYINVLSLVYFFINSQNPPILLHVLFFILTLFLFLERVWDVLIYRHGQLSDWWMGFFDMFEFFLSILTNTLSFVRIGAFALTHSALMMAIFSLQKLAEGNLFLEYSILIFGNIFVVCMEGFIVGIQTLRLEYYEFFMRFFHGRGRKFTPVKYRKIEK